MPLSSYTPYQRKVIDVLASRLGPAAEDFAQKTCRIMGISIYNLGPGNIDEFLKNMQEIIVRYVEPDAVDFIRDTMSKINR
jgi:hypothetical protein